MSPAEAMERINAVMAHAWMVRNFLKHADEVQEHEELLEVHLGLQCSEALEAAQGGDDLSAALHVAEEQRLQVVEVLGPRRTRRVRMQPHVEVGQLAVLRLQLLEQPRVLDRDGCLVGEGLQKAHLRGAEGLLLKAQYGIDCASNGIITWTSATNNDLCKDGIKYTPDDVMAFNGPTLARLRAIRIGIVVRSDEPDLKDNTLTGQKAVLFNCSTGACQGSIALDKTILTDYFRFRTYETIVPMRNAIWNTGT